VPENEKKQVNNINIKHKTNHEKKTVCEAIHGGGSVESASVAGW
jgi:hypothetical protein